jgi:hypothetical protein
MRRLERKKNHRHIRTVCTKCIPGCEFLSQRNQTNIYIEEKINKRLKNVNIIYHTTLKANSHSHVTCPYHTLGVLPVSCLLFCLFVFLTPCTNF